MIMLHHLLEAKDSMVQWQDCRPECWEAFGPEFNPRPRRVGVRFLYKLGQPPKTFISYSLLSVAQLLGEITLKSFIFISYHRSCYLCRLHVQKSSPSYMSEPPLKKGGEPFLKIKNINKLLETVWKFLKLILDQCTCILHWVILVHKACRYPIFTFCHDPG